MKPGQLFEYGGQQYIYLAVSSVAFKINMPILEIGNYKSLKRISSDCQSKLLRIWENQSNQSVKAEHFFQFRPHYIEYTPYDIEKDIIQECNEDGKLNLILHAKQNELIALFLGKKPIYVKEQFVDCYRSKKCRSTDCKIKRLFNFVFIGYIREIEKENNIMIPTVISAMIKMYIKIACAIFFCKGFKAPLFGVYDKNNIVYDSA